MAPVKVQGVTDYTERKVFSIPCTQWSQQVVEDFNVYEIPNTGSNIIRYKPVYLTFRKGEEGEMSNLYKIEKLIILNFNQDLKIFLKDKSFNINYRQKVKAYAEYMQNIGIWNQLPDTDKLVFFLSDTFIELKNKPRPLVNNYNSEYFELSKLLNNSVV